jgi:periplasmic protein TonB
MLAYSANRPAAAARSQSPNSMLFIVALHVAAVAVLMSAKMELPTFSPEPPLVIETIKPEPVPEPQLPSPQRQRPAADPTVSLPDPLVPIPSETVVIPTPDPLPLLGLTGTGSAGGTAAALPIAATPAVLLTGAAELKPPYPPSKLASGEGATLKLRLTVDPAGRVVAVEPIGRADRAFLAAARRHILAHWRYRPATSDGRGVTTTLVISLRFQLDD